jgi:hypothetical protein
LDFRTVSGPLTAEYGTSTRKERVRVGETPILTLSLVVDSVPSKTTVFTWRSRLPLTLSVPPDWTRALPEQSAAHSTFEIRGSGV